MVHRALSRRILILTIVSVFVIQYSGYSQPANPDTVSSTLSLRKNIAAYSIAGFSAFTIFVEYQWWWKGQGHKFSIRSTNLVDSRSRGVDKVGHFYTAYFIYSTVNDLLRWSDADEKKRFWVSIVVPSLHAVIVELGDGFSRYYFDPNDLAANFLGVGYGILQSKYPFLENFVFKFSYYPSGWIPLDSQWELGADYDGHIYWLSVNLHNVLPETMSDYWPKYLNLALGYGAKNISRGASGDIRRSFSIGLDYNLNAFPPFGETWSLLKNILDKFKLPAPGLRVYEGGDTEAKAVIVN